jgi:glycosyltransferase involved in cell wall biosynthesis
MKVSICVPVYNGEDTLKQLYKEIVQAFSKSSILFEILFAFDNGKKESWKILKQLKEKDNGRIRIFHFAKNF